MGALRGNPELGPDTARLRVNRLLNMSGRTGRSAGNALGVLGLFFSSFESGIGYFSDGRTPDAANSVAAGMGPRGLHMMFGPRSRTACTLSGLEDLSLLVGTSHTFTC